MSLYHRLLSKARRDTGRVSLSASDLDFKLKPYLSKRNGFFIEAGANDGLRQSNTLYYERFRGWRGLLVEAVPELAEQCRRNRPKSRVENCALVAADHKGASIGMTYCNLMSQVDGARGSAEEDRRCLDIGVRNEPVTRYRLDAPARTLTSLLDQVRPPQIDFFSLDVEGYELSALRGLDMARYRPTYLMVEANARPALEEYLRPWYRHVADLSGSDILYEALPGERSAP